jgi:hypothetical protein
MKVNGMVDLHTHTNQSDGLLPPETLVQMAAEVGLRAIAITDHDEIGALEIAISIGDEFGIEIIPGVELSAVHQGYDVHILGYFIDFHHPRLLEFLNYFRNERLRRVHRILEKLNTLGCRVSLESVMRKAGPGSVGRPHVADVLLEEGHVTSYKEAFNRFLADGKAAFVPKVRLSPAEAVTIIHEAHGVACLAHPGQNLTEPIILDIIRSGVDAIEVVHPKHSAHQREHFREHAVAFGLLETGGSDFHGGRKGEEKLGDYVVGYEKVEKIRDFVGRVKQ